MKPDNDEHIDRAANGVESAGSQNSGDLADLAGQSQERPPTGPIGMPTDQLNAVAVGSVEEEELTQRLHDCVIDFARRHARRIRSQSNREAFSDTSSIVYEAILDTVRKKGPFESQYQCRNVLRKVIVGRVIDELRKFDVRRSKAATTDDDDGVDEVSGVQQDLKLSIDSENAMNDLASELSEAHEVFQCRVFGDMTWEETAEATGLTIAAARSRFEVAKRFLALRLGGE